MPHHQLDVLEVTDEASLAAYQRAARADLDARSAARAGSRSWPAAPGCTSGPRWTAWRSRRPTPSVRRRLEQRLGAAGAGGVARRAGRAGSRCRTGDPAVERPPDRAGARGHRADRAAVQRDPARPRTTRRPTVQIGLAAGPATARPPHRRPGRADVGARPGRGGASGWSGAGCATGGRRPAPSATPRCSPLDGRTSEPRRARLTAQATRRLIRRQESWFRRDPRIHWLPADAPDLVDRALAVVGAVPARRSGQG